jgi:hypothetical protein
MRHALRSALAFLAVFAFAAPAPGASYVAATDDSLARRAGTIVLARAGASEGVRAEGIGVETVTRFDVLSRVRGAAPTELTVVVPGGVADDLGVWIDGVPRYVPGHEYLLFLNRQSDGRYRVTELALGSFDVLVDADGTRYAARGEFVSGGLQALAQDGQAVSAEPIRDLGLFMQHLARAGRPEARPRGENAEGAASGYHANPTSPLRPAEASGNGTYSPLWVSIVYNDTTKKVRWTNPTAEVGYVDDDAAVLNHEGMPGGGVTEFAPSVNTWTNDNKSLINLTPAGASPSKAITVHWDNLGVWFDGGTGLPCSGGTAGLGGPSFSFPGTVAHKGDDYHPAGAGVVYMRKFACVTPLPTNAFQNILTHELGHVLGLNHPDQGQSNHDVTSNAAQAVMKASTDTSRAVGLGVDDVEGMCWLYGACGNRGDVNVDGALTVQDVFHMISALFAGGPAPVGSGDANNDTFFTVADVFFMINFLFAGGPAPAA